MVKGGRERLLWERASAVRACLENQNVEPLCHVCRDPEEGFTVPKEGRKVLEKGGRLFSQGQDPSSQHTWDPRPGQLWRNGNPAIFLCLHTSVLESWPLKLSCDFKRFLQGSQDSCVEGVSFSQFSREEGSKKAHLKRFLEVIWKAETWEYSPLRILSSREAFPLMLPILEGQLCEAGAWPSNQNTSITEKAKILE